MLNTFDLETRYYTPAEKNTQLIPFTKTIMLNRIIWLSVALIITTFAYFRFSFIRFLQPVTEKIKKQKKGEVEENFAAKMPAVTQSFSSSANLRVWWQLVKIEFLNIVKDNYFRAILLGGVVFLIVDFWIGYTNFGVPDRPLTIFLMDYKNFNYQLFNFIILLFYTGEAIHREKTTGFHIINDALPVSNFRFFSSKLAGLIGVSVLLVSIPMVAGVLIQTLKGHTIYQLDVYFTDLYLISLPGFILMILLSFTVHLIANNKFAGHGVALFLWITMFMLRNFGEMDYNLFYYSYLPNYRWSDINGLGHFAAPLFWFTLYWMFFGAVILTIAFLFYQRGITGSF
ncbi:MAG: ABC transporter permease, partial [Bacteroidia bacterium]